MNKRTYLKIVEEVLDYLYFNCEGFTNNYDDMSSIEEEKLNVDLVEILENRVIKSNKESINHFINIVDFERIRKSFGDAECRRYLKKLNDKE